MKNMTKKKIMTNMTKEDIINPVEIPSDDEIIANAKKEFQNIIDNFINTTIIELKDEDYSNDITWKYNLNKDLSTAVLPFKLPYGYFSEDLIMEVVKNNPPIRKKIYFQITVQEPYAPKLKLEFLFKKQREINAKLMQMQTQLGAEIEAIAETETGEELQTQLNNLILGFNEEVQKIQTTDTFNYLDWVYKI